MDCFQKDWYCTQCSLQFDSKCVYDLHIKFVHVLQILTKSIENEPKTNESHQGEDKILPISPFHEKSPLLLNKNKPFQCEKCSFCCSQKTKLKRHVAIVHDKKKPFSCRKCDYTCSQKRHLKEHDTTLHEGKKPFKCESCDYSCARKGTIDRHIASVHEGKKPFKCETCEYSTAEKRNLNQHVALVHEVNLVTTALLIKVP